MKAYRRPGTLCDDCKRHSWCSITIATGRRRCLRCVARARGIEPRVYSLDEESPEPEGFAPGILLTS